MACVSLIRLTNRQSATHHWFDLCRGAASSLDLETMLGLFQTLALEESTPSAIEFIAGELRLKTQPISDAQLASLSTRLQAQGYAAQMRGDSLVISVERRP